MTSPIDIKHNSLKYTCWGDGLRRSGYAFEADLTPYLPHLFKNGKVKKGLAKRQQWDGRNEPMDWWKAQCAFRGLPQTGKLEDLHNRLRSAPNVKTKELAELEQRANAEWEAKDAVAKADEERELEALQRKDMEEALRALKLTFEGGGKNAPDAIVMKKGWESMRPAAESLKLYSSILRAPVVSFNLDEDYHWIVIGKTKGSVDAKVASIRKEADDFIAAQERRKDAEAQQKRDEIANKHAAIAKGFAKGAPWDVTGTWKITCEEIDSDYGVGERTLKIYRVDGKSNSQMFAEFDFGLITGWFRFESLTQQKASGYQKDPVAGQKRKRAAEDIEEEDDEGDEENDNEDEDEEDNEAFNLSPGDKPSPKQPKWNYRWRGEETGEGEIQIGSETKQNPITFSGPGGTKLTGTFECKHLSKCEFRGIKIGVGEPAAVSIEREWRDRNEAAYERARVGRWH